MGIVGTVLFIPTKHVLHAQTVALKMIETFLNYLVTLPKDVAPLRVAQDHPVHATVFDHRRAADHIRNRKHYSNAEIHIIEDSKRDRSERIHDRSEPLSGFFWTYVPDLPGEGTLGCFVAILSSPTKLGVQLGPDEVQVDGWRTAHHLYRRGGGGRQVQSKISCY